GKTLASASNDKTVRLWDVTTAKERASLQGHTGLVYAVAFSPDGKTLASASDDKTVKLWDVTTGKEADRRATGITIPPSTAAPLPSASAIWPPEGRPPAGDLPPLLGDLHGRRLTPGPW